MRASRPCHWGFSRSFSLVSYIRVRIKPTWYTMPCLTIHDTSPMVSPDAKEVFIQGITQEGKTFRPSDWAERLAGVMSQFRPGGAIPGSHLSYSPWCVPTNVNGVKCVVVNRDLQAHEPMAWDFVLSFAKDNNLQIAEACLLPDPKA